MPEAVCVYYGGNHVMKPKAIVSVVNEQHKKVNMGRPGLYTCQCKERFISEGSPHFGGVIGKYVTEGGIVGEAIVSGAGVTVIKESLIRETSARTLTGYTFLAL